MNFERIKLKVLPFLCADSSGNVFGETLLVPFNELLLTITILLTEKQYLILMQQTAFLLIAFMMMLNSLLISNYVMV